MEDKEIAKKWVEFSRETGVVEVTLTRDDQGYIYCLSFAKGTGCMPIVIKVEKEKRITYSLDGEEIEVVYDD